MKDSSEVVQEFNEIVNMTSTELEKWLKSDDSRSAGWPKEDEGGESVGHDSGRKIVEILKSNPNKDPEKYTDDQISHMRKVVSYCKRHLAQEKQSHQNKSTEEIKQTKSYASLKNWGHDPLKGEQNGNDQDAEDGDDEEGDTQENAEQENAEQENGEKQAGDKRKKDSGTQSGANKKRETRQGKASTNGQKKKQDDDEDEEEGDENDNEDGDDDQEANGEDNNDEEDDGDDDEGKSGGKKPKKGPKPGDTVSWPWGGGNPEGKVLDVKGETTEITTKRGSKVTRHGDPEDPAVVLDTGKSKAVKSNHELN